METRHGEVAWESADSHLLLNPKLSPEDRAAFERLVATRASLRGHVWIASSGTTGAAPKVIGLSKGALLASARGVNEFFSVTAADVWALLLPTWHVGGLGIVARAHVSGSRVETFSGAWNALDAGAWLEKTRATLVSLVPTQLYDLVLMGVRAPSSLRAAILGGAALDADLRARAEALGWPIVATFGMSEGCSMIAASSAFAKASAPKAADSGKMTLLPHWEARVGADDRLELRGPSLFTTWGREVDGVPEWHDRVGDWWTASDRVRLSGREIEWLGRDDDFVKVKGEGVSLNLLRDELEEFLRAESAGFTSVGIFAVEDARRGFILVAALQASEWFGPIGVKGGDATADPTALLERFNARRLSHERIATSVVRTAWPRTDLGKLKKTEARMLILNAL